MKKADNFDASKWLIENKITTQSRLNEMAAKFRDLIIYKTTDDEKFKQQYYLKLVKKYSPEFYEVLAKKYNM